MYNILKNSLDFPVVCKKVVKAGHKTEKHKSLIEIKHKSLIEIK